jgi:hypothetical protein
MPGNFPSLDEEDPVCVINRGIKAMEDYEPWEFTCKTCGGHRLTVTRVWSMLAGPDSESWQEWGPLLVNHHWRFEFKEKIEKEEDNEVERGDYGEFAEDDSSSEPEEYEIFELESDSESDEFYVNCASCDREIEFGWSQPNRGGRIYPVECSDFIPEKVWPDPKYVDAWKQRGWLRRGHTQP